MAMLDDLQGMDTQQLMERARQLGIDAEGLDRDELIDEIGSAQSSEAGGMESGGMGSAGMDDPALEGQGDDDPMSSGRA